jgi:hypothetical protein
VRFRFRLSLGDVELTIHGIPNKNDEPSDQGCEEKHPEKMRKGTYKTVIAGHWLSLA